jgi:hypothetical protein
LLKMPTTSSIFSCTRRSTSSIGSAVHQHREKFTSYLSYYRRLFTELSVGKAKVDEVVFAGNAFPNNHAVAYGEQYWRKIPRWNGTTVDQFLSHKWQVRRPLTILYYLILYSLLMYYVQQMSNAVQSPKALYELLRTVLPDTIPPGIDSTPVMCYDDIHTPDDFIARVKEGVRRAPMAIRLSPHILSVINWSDPLNDPVHRQFVPLAHPLKIDHPMATLDSLQENQFSPVSGLVHRYPDRALFLGEFPPG